MSLARALAQETLDALISRLSLREVGSPRLPLHGPDGARLGALRRFVGDAASVVTVSLAVPAFGLDSHMLLAATPAGSATPHFTLDAVQTGPGYACHVDLLPRVDLAVNLEYHDAVFGPLAAVHAGAVALPGLAAAAIPVRLRAVLPPWTLAYLADASAFERLGSAVRAYRERWLELCAVGLPGEVVAGLCSVDLAQRDRRMRAALFDPATDPVWARIDRLVGPGPSAQIRRFLRGEEE